MHIAGLLVLAKSPIVQADAVTTMADLVLVTTLTPTTALQTVVVVLSANAIR